MPLSPLRTQLLRACYLLLAAGLAATALVPLLQGQSQAPLMDGVVNALLAALGLLAIAGLFAPVRMIPLLAFEVLWKTLWVMSVAAPQWVAGGIDAEVHETLFACAFAIPFVVIIPWRHWLTQLHTPEAATARRNGASA
ncbi:hypothetical protein [Maricaulis sp.]|uniref:hypothetical protein n=1 Tax=Maricaulis sp. TaxID=1486257 RepID=UPI00262F812C|nr:hypothetical protein [Maricaulis sp.]